MRKVEKYIESFLNYEANGYAFPFKDVKIRPFLSDRDKLIERFFLMLKDEEDMKWRPFAVRVFVNGVPDSEVGLVSFLGSQRLIDYFNIHDYLISTGYSFTATGKIWYNSETEVDVCWYKQVVPDDKVKNMEALL